MVPVNTQESVLKSDVLLIACQLDHCLAVQVVQRDTHTKKEKDEWSETINIFLPLFNTNWERKQWNAFIRVLIRI